MTETRSNKRYSVAWPGRVAVDKDTILDVKVIDIGVGGVKFVSPMAVSKGKKCKIEICPSVEGAPPIRAVVTVDVSVLNELKGATIGSSFSYIPPQYVTTLNDVLKNLTARLPK